MAALFRDEPVTTKAAKRMADRLACRCDVVSELLMCADDADDGPGRGLPPELPGKVDDIRRLCSGIIEGMDPALKSISSHMKDLGLAALSHALYLSCFDHSMFNPYHHEMAILNTAHATEILIKARIAEEHPLLIFSKIPSASKKDPLNHKHLFEGGQTIAWKDLRERLWASTGIDLEGGDKFEKFGKFRNGIQHYAPPPAEDLSRKALEFIFGVVDPMLEEFWGLNAIDCNREDYDDSTYIISALANLNIRFRVSDSVAYGIDRIEVNWREVSPAYRTKIERQIEEITGEPIDLVASSKEGP